MAVTVTLPGRVVGQLGRTAGCASCDVPVATTTLLHLKQALANFEALYVVPSLQCFWSTSSIVMGGIFFQVRATGSKCHR